MGIQPQRYDQKDEQFRQHFLSATRTDTNQALVANTWTIVLFNTEFFDESSAYNTGTGAYTIPQNGVYNITSRIRLSAGTLPFFTVYSLWKNGADHRRGQETTISSNGLSMTLVVENKFTVGEILTPRVFIAAGIATPIIEFVENTGVFNYITIRRVGT